MLGFIKKLTNKKEDRFNEDIKIIARCPKCGKEVIETGDCWACIDVLSGTCNFRISNIHNGKKMSIEALTEYQRAEEYQRIYDAIHNNVIEGKTLKEKRELEIKSNHKYAGNEFFEKGVRLHGSCPRCKEDIYKLGDTVKCMNAPDHCSFSMKSIYKGVRFTDEEMNKLLRGYVSDEYMFTDNSGKKFSGRVFIDINKKTADKLPRFKYIKDIQSFIESIDDPEDYYLKFVYRTINGKFCRMNGELVHQFPMKKEL